MRTIKKKHLHKWVGMNTAVFSLGIPAVWFVMSRIGILEKQLFEKYERTYHTSVMALAIIIVGTIVGLFLGWGQAGELGYAHKKKKQWVIKTLAGLVIGMLASTVFSVPFLFLSPIFGFGFAGFLVGLLMSLAQTINEEWKILRKGLWIVGSGIGLGVGVVVGLLLRTYTNYFIIVEDSLQSIDQLWKVLQGLIIGIIAGLAACL